MYYFLAFPNYVISTIYMISLQHANLSVLLCSCVPQGTWMPAAQSALH